ncbi:MAG: TrkH family potassium uptake protein [bacterium]
MVSKLAIKLQLHLVKIFYNELKNDCKKTLNFTSGIAVLISLTLYTLEFGFKLNTANQSLFTQMYHYIYGYFVIEILLNAFYIQSPLTYIKKKSSDLVVLLPLIPYQLPFITPFIIQISIAIIIVKRLSLPFKSFQKIKVKPANLFILGFLLSIFIGSLLLSLPISNHNLHGISYIDALFTATSAICVTGLVVNNIHETFSTFGTSIILILVQIGGLGIMSFAILLSLVMKRKVSQLSSQEFQNSYNTFNLKETFSAIKFIFKFTLMIEIIGAAILFISFNAKSLPWPQRLFHAIFHSVSAFCNAGFALFSDSLEQFQYNSLTLLCIATLIIIGGIGFPVLFNVIQIKKKNKSFKWLKLQTKIALITTAILLMAGTLIFWLSEQNHALQHQPFTTQWINAFFQITSARTAGLNSLDLNTLYPSTLIILLILMIIGASPGSTGGGIKTTNFGILMIAFWQSIKSSQYIEAGGRRIPYDIILKTLSILILYLISIFIIFYSLLLLESDINTSDLLFETISAFGTVGFSMGITAELSKWGKLIIIVAMFIGRMGPLTMAFALSKPKQKTKHYYPEENISII